MIESILVEDESSMLFSTGKLPEKQVFLCNRKFLGIPYYTKSPTGQDFLLLPENGKEEQCTRAKM